MKSGILMVLHSFGSELSLHYHVHMLLTGGGLTEDGKNFKRCLSNTFFLPVRALTRVYKGKFMDGFKKLRSDDRLDYYNDALKYRNSYTWKELLNSCYKADWNVEIKYLAPVPAGEALLQRKRTRIMRSPIFPDTRTVQPSPTAGSRDMTNRASGSAIKNTTVRLIPWGP
jgi:hypothetical protein